MASIVLVHGIAQELLGPQTLLRQWLPALADGVNKYGDSQLARRIFSHAERGDIDVQMAYYATRFLDGDRLDDDDPDLENTPMPTSTDEELIGRFADSVLHAAADAARDPSDRAAASNALEAIYGATGEEQGVRALARPLINALSQLRWFANPTMKLAAPLVWRALTQVTRYFSDDEIRAYAQQQVLNLLGSDTKLIVGHSLGSVVAYEALHLSQHPAALITLGSPLGLTSVVYEKLRPATPHVPPRATSWYNFAAKDDLVAARLDLAPLFPSARGASVLPISRIVDTGSKPHDVVHYLTQPICGEAVRRALTNYPRSLNA